MPLSTRTAEVPAKTSAGVRSDLPRTEYLMLFLLSAAMAALHTATNGRYGFHRDELQFLYDARHLDWGFVAYPPFTPFVEHIGLSLFGLSLVGLRMFSVIAQGLVIYVAGLMARELGGGRLAQFTAALTVALSPLPIFEGTEFQYSSFDLLWWVLIAYFTVRLLRTDDARWWLAIGATVGLGLLTKYSIVFYIAGILAGVILTPARRYFLSKWFWAGIALALVIFLPNFVWLARHDFMSYQFLQHIHARDVGEGRAQGFISGQFLMCVNAAAAPIWITGLIACLRNRRYRMLAWMYLVPFVAFLLAKGRFYYLCGAYPVLLAMGSAAFERWVTRLRRPARVAIDALLFTAVTVIGACIGAVLIPLASSGPLRDFALKYNGDLREEFGWNELVQTVAGIRDSLPPDQQAHLGITVGNYGEAGAIEILGPVYHLPPPISTTNSGWLRGYPTEAPSTLIVLGLGREEADSIFTGCHWAGHNGNVAGVSNEESRDHPDIFVCGPPRLRWPELWKRHHDFG